MRRGTLIIFSGLPGAGKTAIAAEAARRLGAAYIRIDTFEAGLEELLSIRVGGEGYRLAQRIAADNLRLGLDAVADCVNPWELTRREWEAAATGCGAGFANVEVVCSDRSEHRRRVEGRASDIPGLALPTWEEVLARDYHPWNGDRIVVETSGRAVDDCVEELLRAFEARRDAIGSQGPLARAAPAGGETDLRILLASMEPELGDREYVFAALEADPPGDLLRAAWAMVREEEGPTLILERGAAATAGFAPGPAFRRITLRVRSSLEAVGLTAAVSAALAGAGISANVVAAFYHDHVFVPAPRAEEALAALRDLARETRQGEAWKASN